MITENQDQYVEILKKRALGALPHMGSALRVADIISEMGGRSLDLLDVGGAAGHYLTTFLDCGIDINEYTVLEIDPNLVRTGKEIWKEKIEMGMVSFIHGDAQSTPLTVNYDYIIIMNAFMYFKNIEKILTAMIPHANKAIIIRSYFGRENYRIIRAQTKNNHDRSVFEEIDVFDNDGNILSYDLWNVYTHSYIEALVGKIDVNKRIRWESDNNYVDSLKNENNLNLNKDGRTEFFDGKEVSYPFILPWEYLIIE